MKKSRPRALQKRSVTKSRSAVTPAPHAKRVRPVAPRQTESARQESEAAYRTLVETSHDLIWSVDAEGRWTFVNAAARRIYGYEPAEMLGRPFMDFQTPEQAEKDLKVFASIKAGTPYFNYETEHRRKDGTPVWLSFNAVVSHDEQGRVIGTTGTAQDITERKRTEAALRDREADYRALFEQAAVGVAQIETHTGRFARVNRRYCDITGYTEEEMQRLTFQETTHPDDLQPDLDNMGRLHRGEIRDFSMEKRLIRKSGEIVWVNLSVSAPWNFGGTTAFHTAVVEDITERKQTERARDHSLSLMLATLESTADGILVVNVERKFEIFNQVFARMWRVPDDVLAARDDAHGMQCVLDQLKEPQQFIEKINYLYAHLEEESFDILEFKDGRVFERYSRAQRIGERVVGRVWSFRDITERKRIEESLRLEGAALEAAANAIFITGRDGVIQWINPAFATLSGYAASEVIGQKPNLIKSDAHDETFYQDLWQTILAGQVWRGQITNRHKDGHLYVCEQTIAPVKDAQGEITHFVSVQQDVTDHKKAEGELHWKTAFFEAQVDSALDGILVVDSEGKKILQNQRMNELWKIPWEIVEEKDDARQLEFVTGRTKNPAQFAEKVAYLYSHPDEISRDEIELVDGTILERFSSPVRNKAGKNYGRIWTFRDITERRKLEEQFRQSQKMESIGQLAGGVAHDFNNILSVIIGHSSMIQLGGQTPEEQAGALRQINQAAERAANLTRQLLAFSRRQVMQARSLDLNEVSANMTRMLQRLIGENIVLQTRYAPEGSPVQADPGMIEQVLLNLVVNARDAMPEGGQISIETSRVLIDEARASQRPNERPGDFIRLSVRDTGSGIAPDHLPRIFEPFFTTKEVGKGTGLGLATVFGIVEQHQGWVEVESEIGRGTVFHIFLPRHADTSARLVGQQATAKVRGGHETILLVEDEPALRALSRNVLERYGYLVYEAPSGVAALEVWREQKGVVDLLLTDMVMPEGVSGRELAAQLQAETPQLKIIYMSGYPGDVAGRGLSLNEGINFLQKPFSPIKLAEIVRAALDAK